MAKMMSPNTTILWVPLGGIVDPDAPTVAELEAGINISAAIVTGYTLGATDSDTDESKTIVDEGNVKTPTFGNYAGSLTLFRDGVGDTPTVFTTAYNLFKDGRVEGYLVSRQGYKATAPFEAGQLVSAYRFISDFQQDIEGDKGAPIQATIPFRPQGVMAINVPVAA